jgi:hypothetical protein
MKEETLTEHAIVLKEISMETQMTNFKNFWTSHKNKMMLQPLIYTLHFANKNSYPILY